MAKLIKKQEKQYNRLMELYHELIRAKFSNKREVYEQVIETIRKEINNVKE